MITNHDKAIKGLDDAASAIIAAIRAGEIDAKDAQNKYAIILKAIIRQG
jgi:hypothetical protein